jgi:LPS export ABC transporter protein LptC
MNILRSRHLLLLLAIVLAGALVLYVVVRSRQISDIRDISTAVKALPSGIDLALENIDYTQSTDGRARWRLVADRAEHHADAGMLALKNLNLTAYDDQGEKHSVLSAEQGQVDKEYTVVNVWGNVVIENRDGYRFETDRLNYSPESRIATTDSHVKVQGEGLLLEADGMWLDVEQRRLKLNSAVEAVIRQK